MISTLNSLLIVIIAFLIFLIWIFYRLGFKQGTYKSNLHWQERIPLLRRDIAESQRAGIKGKVAETFAPFLPNFPFKASECKFLGEPIDYVVFKGLNERNINSIHFLEVKSDKSKLSAQQKQIKEILNKLNSDKVTFKEFNFKTNENYKDTNSINKEILED